MSAPDQTSDADLARATATLEEQVWRELRQCYDPELPVNIVDLGLVYDMQHAPLAEGGHRVEVLMTVTSPACAISEVLRTEVEQRIRLLPDVREVAVEITFDPPWSIERMTDDARMLLNM
jgi:metal-sulfur cluster biosynthetic enzyme